jgi:NADPH:quinone reductase
MAMRRIEARASGPPSVLELVEGPEPVPGPGEVLVRIAAAGVNFLDLVQRRGTYRVSFPWTPGMEASGTVLQCGPDVTGYAVGDRVAWYGVPGGYATHGLVPAGRLVPVPDGISLTDAAAALVQGMTAHCLTHDTVHLDGTSTCLVHAAAGGVGRLLCQFASLRGATVIGTVSTSDRVAAARAAGATHVVDYSTLRFADQVRQLTGEVGVDVVFDAVGRDTFAEGLSCLRPRGTFVLYGQVSGPVECVDPQVLNARGSVYFTKPSLSHYDRTRADVLRRADRVFSGIRDRSLRLHIHAVYPLEDAAAAHAALEARSVVGKLLICP